MKLAAKIFAALAIAFAISYVAAWDISPDARAAAGKIDVLNVGTCYATDSSAFGEADCKDNRDLDADGNEDGEFNLDTGSNAGIQGIEVTARPFATYAVDPKTSAEEPRAILQDADLLMLSIADEGRDKRTPVLLKAGVPGMGNAANHIATGPTVTAETGCYDNNGDFEVDPRGSEIDGLDRELCKVHQLVNGNASNPVDDLLNFQLTQTFIERPLPGGTAPNEAEFDVSRASNNILEVRLPSTAPATEDFLPLHREFEDDNFTLTKDTVIKFFGYLVSDTQTGDQNGCTRISMTDLGNIGGAALTPPPICDLSPFIKFDEDIGSGSTRGELPGNAHSAPFITFGTRLNSSDTIRVRYVYYETSEREDLIGNRKSAGSSDLYPEGAFTPVFTNDESGDQPDPLVIEAVGDGVARTQHLWLKETGRFTGVYEGFLRLTDANGNSITTDNESEPNWGRPVGPATGADEAGAAVLGVQGGPVNVRYRDSDGTIQTLRILVDTQPPVVLIDTPEYKANFDDQRVRVAGTFSDADSGLRDDSFRLYLDNLDDNSEDGETKGRTVLKLAVNEGAETEGGTNAVGLVKPKKEGGVVQLTGDYEGFAEDTDGPMENDGLFGVLRAPWIFKSLTGPTSGGGTRDELKKIDPDSYQDGDTEASFDDVARLDIQNADGTAVTTDLNNQIDFQALVMDIAGNVGFSDSDPAGPTFIHDYGTAMGPGRKSQRYNVLGWYARHIISIDQQDPRLGRVVTGFYDEDDDDNALVNNRGLMLIFDAAVDADSVDSSTFKVELDAVGSADPIDAVVVDATTFGDRVYLLLSDDLAPDATPKLSVISGRQVRDPAGNTLGSNDSLDGTDDGSREIEANDGIPPTFTVELSRGSGTGTGDEDASNLTRHSIVVRITSNEDIQGAPDVSFVCDGFTWVDMGTDLEKTSDDVTRDFTALLNNRKGKQSIQNASEFEPNDERGTCGDDDDTRLRVQRHGTYSRPGNTWEYQWRNSETENLTLPDGDVTVVAFGRDTSDWDNNYDPDNSGASTDTFFNWGAATAEFEVDSNLGDPSTTDSEFGSVQPGADSEIFESRPFVLLTFQDASTVGIDSFKVDGTAQDITALPNNRFLYWPESLDFGKHKVEVEAVDAAANERNFSYEFEVKQRTAFTVELLAGWNAVSVPATPVNPDISSVFTIEEVDQVVGWDAATPDAPWRIATKVDGVWSTNLENAPLDTILAGKGYWVHANGFVDQTVMLSGTPDREAASNAPEGPVGIGTVKGWNFVGVVDTDGDQTQDGDFGEMLKDSKQDMVTAKSYLRNYKQAYTWDPIKSQFNVIEDEDGMSIGDGVWVYYAEGFNIAP